MLHLIECHLCLLIGGLGLGEVDACNQDDLLPEVVEGDDSVKEHQIHVPEILGVCGIQVQGLLGVLQVVVGEVPDKAACKRGQKIKAGALVLRQHLADVPAGIVRLKREGSDLHVSVPTGDLQCGIKTEERVPSPALLLVGGFEHVAVIRHVLHPSQHLQRGDCIREDLPADRNAPVLSLFCQLQYFRKPWSCHVSLLTAMQSAGCFDLGPTKNALDRNSCICFCQGRRLLCFAVPPCFTVIPCSLRDTNISPTPDAGPLVTAYFFRFGRALSGPSAVRCSARFHPPGSLVDPVFCVFSASTV